MSQCYSAREGKKGKPVSPIALEAVRHLDALFEIERAINGRGADERRAVRQEKSKPLLEDMHAWLFLDDGGICLTNNCAERALRGIALGRRNWTFAGSQRGADHAAIMLTMITTCRHNDVDPEAWLAGVLARIADLPASRLHELLPGNGSSCARPASPPINRPPDLGRHHETLRARAQASIRRPSSYAYVLSLISTLQTSWFWASFGYLLWGFRR
jgi:hypothetical protein